MGTTWATNSWAANAWADNTWADATAPVEPGREECLTGADNSRVSLTGADASRVSLSTDITC
jgi:hypothetical protein